MLTAPRREVKEMKKHKRPIQNEQSKRNELQEIARQMDSLSEKELAYIAGVIAAYRNSSHAMQNVNHAS